MSTNHLSWSDPDFNRAIQQPVSIEIMKTRFFNVVGVGLCDGAGLLTLDVTESGLPAEVESKGFSFFFAQIFPPGRLCRVNPACVDRPGKKRTDESERFPATIFEKTLMLNERSECDGQWGSPGRKTKPGDRMPG